MSPLTLSVDFAFCNIKTCILILYSDYYTGHRCGTNVIVYQSSRWGFMGAESQHLDLSSTHFTTHPSGFIRLTEQRTERGWQGGELFLGGVVVVLILLGTVIRGAWLMGDRLHLKPPPLFLVGVLFAHASVRHLCHFSSCYPTHC